MTPLYHPQQSPIPATSGIYRIVCLANKRIYIGSSGNLRKRWKGHFALLRGDKHSNPSLQRAWNKYGEVSFIFEVLELILTPFLLEREQYWLDKLKPFGKKGFNLARSALASRLGAEVLPSTREKLRATRLGKPSPLRGRKATPEAIEINRQSHLGQEISLAAREKLRVANLGNTRRLGHKHSEASRHKMRKTHLELPRNEKALAALATAHIAHMKFFIVTAPDGIEYTVHGLTAFCKEHHLDQGAMTRVAQGKRTHYKEWKARYLEMGSS